MLAAATDLRDLGGLAEDAATTRQPVLVLNRSRAPENAWRAASVLLKGLTVLRAMEQGLDIAGQTMAEMILENPELSDGPLSAHSYCIWATTYASDQSSPSNAPWRAECAEMLAGLTPQELKQADSLAQTLVSSE